ncbi:MAG: DUF3427 domain-containing protein [Candidatus Hydrogenedentes bacterium]|nr:DUF3427 domain-containing protein [Candidatus Hydrogenedentota bacterium]
MQELPDGLYELLHTPQLRKRLEEAGLSQRAAWESIDPAELPTRLTTHVARELAAYVTEIITGTDECVWTEALTSAFCAPGIITALMPEVMPDKAKMLYEISPALREMRGTSRPDTPLAMSALLTGSSRSPALRTQLEKELATCDRADWLVSFIKYAGIVPLLGTLRAFTQSPAPDGSPRLRIATTSYMGATDVKAIEELLKLPNTEIRVSYDTKRTRLHAKAYLFHRDTGFGSAYIGSANVSKAALDDGLEWTAKISQYETAHLWRHIVATFESHWEDATEFTPCHMLDLPTLRSALALEIAPRQMVEEVGFFDLRPYEYQKAILEDIAAERAAGRRKHLVIAATGTGKTVISAFDYKAFCTQSGGLPRLLFVAHREEILRQARATFRQVLRDGSFGDLVIGGAELPQHDHLFCTVQSWMSRGFDKFPPDHHAYVVLDEAHHASSASYQALVNHVKPKSLLGLTATPERTDGADIRDDFDGAFTHEIRLPEAIERALLCPFHYFGVPDLEGLDFSAVSWKRGGYDVSELASLIEGNDARANWVMSQADRYLADLQQVRGLGFCLSVKHAEFMAEHSRRSGLPSVALTGETGRDVRQRVQRQLEQREIRFIFTVDIYNEGVDIPCVDTVLFLRPTESLTLFLQQLGRGLRLHDEKSHLTVLDFIAPQHRQFRLAKRFQALSSRPELRVDKQIDTGMPFVPSGCLVHLEEQAKEHVLNNIRAATRSLRGELLIRELRELRRRSEGEISLQELLDYLHLEDPDELYRRGLPHLLFAQAQKRRIDDSISEYKLSAGFRRLLLMDDSHFLSDARNWVMEGRGIEPVTKAMLHCVIWGNKKPGDGTLDDVDDYLRARSGLRHDLAELLDWLLSHRTPIPATRLPAMTGPLVLHASYTREQILLALGLGQFEKPHSSREGVLHVPSRKLDVFFADIHKAEADFSPSTMYEDYAITDRLFHWQSQSTTSESSLTGRRYIGHREQEYTPVLFLRERKKNAVGLTSPYFFAGPLEYVKHRGSQPMSITWRLEHPLPARALAWARRVA